MYIISKNWHFMCLVKPLKEAFQKFCECMKLKVFNVHLMKHWGAIIMSWSWTQSQWTRECTQFSLGLNYHKKIIIYTLSLMHKGGKKLASKYKVGTLDPCLNHISISWSWTPKGKHQCWANICFIMYQYMIMV